jgi:hypothetical protein
VALGRAEGQAPSHGSYKSRKTDACSRRLTASGGSRQGLARLAPALLDSVYRPMVLERFARTLPGLAADLEQELIKKSRMRSSRPFVSGRRHEPFCWVPLALPCEKPARAPERRRRIKRFDEFRRGLGTEVVKPRGLIAS